MRVIFSAILVIALASAGNALVIKKVSSAREALKREEGTPILIPASISRISALEFRGLASDAFFFRAFTFLGKKVVFKEELTKQEWEWMYKSMDISTELDPYFLDPYYLGSATLAWDAHEIDKANELLEKAFRYRTWDWTIPFQLGFNYFYFLQDNGKAAEYLMEASKRPGASPLLVSLATKLSYKAHRTENAIIFLENILKRTDDERLRREYEVRLQALRRLLYLEQSAGVYRKKFGRYPKVLADLVARNVIPNIPADPYGGTFYIDKQGRVSSTSNFITLYTHN